MEESVLLKSFKEHEGLRGAHLYSPGGECRFLSWASVVKYVNSLPSDYPSEFSDKLLGLLSNYDPDTQFLALNSTQNGSVSIELYEKNHVD
jgi:hypothetical protein